MGGGHIDKYRASGYDIQAMKKKKPKTPDHLKPPSTNVTRIPTPYKSLVHDGLVIAPGTLKPVISRKWTRKEKKKILRYLFRELAKGRTINDMRREDRNPVDSDFPFPLRHRLLAWVNDFGWHEQYKLARHALIEHLVDDTIPISKALGKKNRRRRDTQGAVARDKLIINTAQWMAERLNPIAWGESVRLKGDDTEPIRVHHTTEEDYFKEVASALMEAGVWNTITKPVEE